MNTFIAKAKKTHKKKTKQKKPKKTILQGHSCLIQIL